MTGASIRWLSGSSWFGGCPAPLWAPSWWIASWNLPGNQQHFLDARRFDTRPKLHVVEDVAGVPLQPN